MKGAGRWIAIIVLLVVLIGLGSGVFMTGMSWGRGGAPGYYPMPHMSGYFPGGGWFGMGLMWLIPVGVVALIVWAVATLVNRPAQFGQAGAAGRVCPSCGKPAQSDWSTCPYCSKPLS
jgi:hypothetical protein